MPSRRTQACDDGTTDRSLVALEGAQLSATFRLRRGATFCMLPIRPWGPSVTGSDTTCTIRTQVVRQRPQRGKSTRLSFDNQRTPSDGQKESLPYSMDGMCVQGRGQFEFSTQPALLITYYILRSPQGHVTSLDLRWDRGRGTL